MPPTEVAVVLGVEYNIPLNIVSLPADKLQDVLLLLREWLDRDHATKCELKQLCGKLLYCSRVVSPGRLFLARMLDTERRASRLDIAVPLDPNFKLDCKWWYNNILGWNGMSILSHAPGGTVAVDASKVGFDGDAGIGAFCFETSQYFHCKVPEELQHWHINNLELRPDCGAIFGEVSLSPKTLTTNPLRSSSSLGNLRRTDGSPSRERSGASSMSTSSSGNHTGLLAQTTSCQTTCPDGHQRKRRFGSTALSWGLPPQNHQSQVGPSLMASFPTDPHQSPLPS